MTTEKIRIPLAEAQTLAVEVVELFAPVCERIEIAGSIRRKKETVGDIEIVCVPKFQPEYDLFDHECIQKNLQYIFVNDELYHPLLSLRLDKNGRSAIGERYQRLIYKGFPLDIFCVLPPAQWGVIFMIRTGPDTFSQRMVTGTLMGGKLPTGMQIKDGQLIDRGVSVTVPEEQDFFFLTNNRWIEPEERM